ncbi:MAG: GNAT family N-acetyltransferase [Chloroflexi bacterium]|nr:GNAT family N-acetyltransferase [Chloroflexota bacterium]
MAAYDIQPATVTDLDALAELERIGFPLDQYSNERLKYLLKHANASSYKVEASGRIQAYAMVLWRRASRVGHLYSIVTHPDFQGRGLGGALLSRLETDAAARGCDRIRLEVRADNTTAIRFYLDRGYKVVKELPGFYSEDAPGLRMAKRLQ